MQLIPSVISGAVSPLVKQMYVKEVPQENAKPAHVLVIRTNLDRDTDVADCEDLLLDLLAEMPRIRRAVRNQTGSDVEELEIRYN